MEQSNIDKLASAWWKLFRNQRVLVRDVIFLAAMGGETSSDLRAILEVIAPSSYPGVYSSHRLGHWLTKAANHQALTLPYKFFDRGAPTTATGRYWQLLPTEAWSAAPVETFDEDDVLPEVAGSYSL